MKPGSYRDMQILHEVTQTPQANQRDLAKRIGVALGLTNLILRRLVLKGYIKITGTERNRILYLITPQGLLEKSRLTYEYLEYSLQYYRNVRKFLRERLESLITENHRRILLFGIGELAEIAYLTIQELGLEFVGVVGDHSKTETFLKHPVRGSSEVLDIDFDGIVITSLEPRGKVRQQLLELGVPAAKIIMIPDPRSRSPIPETPSLEEVSK